MSVFDLDTQGQAALRDEAAHNPLDLSQVEPTAMTGFGKAVGSGLMRGGARAVQFVGMGVGATAVAAEKTLGAFGTESNLADPYFEELDRYVNSAVDFWTPSPAEVGKAGQVMGGLAEIVLPLAAGAGNPSLLIGSQELGQATDLTRAGVDAPVAVGAGMLQGASTAVGFKVPFLGAKLWTRMLSGAGGNLAVNRATTKAQQELLEQTGYQALADQYDPLDPVSSAVDVLTGLAFGGLAHVQMSSAERAAIASANNAKHFQQDTAPGRPADVAAAATHVEALETAIDQLLKGEPVSVPEQVTRADFVPRPSSGAERVKGAADLLDITEPLAPPKSEIAAQIPRDTTLAGEDQVIESRFAEQLAQDVDAAIEAYSKLPDAEGGKVISTDVARELSPDYLKDRTRSAAVHEPASWLVKEMYRRRLAAPLKPGEKPLVIFSAGGTGAGKTTGLRVLGEVDPDVKAAQIIFDSNVANLRSAVDKIDMALAAGKQVRILYVFRDPVDAFKEGVLKRAMSQEQKFGSGRTVPIDTHASTHVDARQVIAQLAERYQGHADVDLQFVDNSRGKDDVAIVKLEELPTPEYNRVREDLSQVLEQQRQAGAISDAVYRGTRGEEAPDAGAGPADRGSVREESQTPGRGGRVTPDLLIPTGAIDAEGNAVARPASELVAEASADIERAKQDAKGFKAAITCFLERGG